MATKELQEQINTVKDIAKEDYKWLIRYKTIHGGRLEELIPVIAATNAHKARMDKGK